jgi:hypothetical protein
MLIFAFFKSRLIFYQPNVLILLLIFHHISIQTIHHVVTLKLVVVLLRQRSDFHQHLWNVIHIILFQLHHHHHQQL